MLVNKNLHNFFKEKYFVLYKKMLISVSSSDMLVVLHVEYIYLSK